ncbi:MAG: long-chain fatty acid--CoA ligase [Rhodospirillaceae bacterium]|nr:MAG: long-chain fatty acid--CoA ligase [Rhodospirillaceae bacterium]
MVPMQSSYETWQNLPQMFFDKAEEKGDTPFLWAKRDGKYQSVSWQECASAVRALANGLRALGVHPGDRVVIVSESRPEWLIADIAIMAAGAVTVPAYVTNTLGDHRHILTNSGAKAVIVSTARLAGQVFPAAMDAPTIETFITMEPATPDPVTPEKTASFKILLWEEALDAGRGKPDAGVETAAQATRGDLACLIYTSGTGGAPKGVMLSHGAILHNCRGAHDLLLELGLSQERFLSFLPLSHSYEHMAGQFFPMSIGAEIYYAESIDKLSTNMAEASPTIMTAVPRLYEVLYERISKGVAKAGGLKAKLFARALALGQKAYEHPGTLTFGERVENRVLDALVRRKVAKRFGGKLKVLVSGGAPLNYEVGLFFTALGLRILQGYGQTESAPLISCNPPSNNQIDTVGPTINATEVRIAEDGEILVRGELLMLGYWGDQAASDATIRDGWLHTGDIGQVDGDGFIRITDRKKDIIVNSGGDNISPQRVEGILELELEISQAMVHGDRKAHLVALLVPNTEAAFEWAHAHKKPPEMGALVTDDAFRKWLGDALEHANAKLSSIEKVKRFSLLAEPFTIENSLMTPTMKIRRHKISERYGDILKGLYGAKKAP